MTESNDLRQKDLLTEFEEKLKRPLNGEEKSFIDWIVAQEANQELLTEISI
jgi:hypothetical protein